VGIVHFLAQVIGPMLQLRFITCLHQSYFPFPAS